MQIENNKVVSINYHLTNEAGETLDTSEGREPLAYIQGHNNIIPGLEEELTGKSVGDKLKVVVSPEKGYGNYEEALLQVVPRESFQGVDNIEVGMQFQVNTPQGTQIIAVTKIEGDNITVDGNHPLAGQQLTFDVEVMDIRDASEEELSHGHVHGAGGHHH